MRKLTILLIVLGLGLTACSSAKTEGKSSFGEISGFLKEKLKLVLHKRAQGRSAPSLKRSALAGIKTRLILAHLEKTGTYSALSLVGRNNGFLSMMSPDQRMLVLKDGVLAETRGLSGDLMESDTTALRAALKNPRHPSRFVHKLRWLNGENHPVSADYSCTLRNIGTQKITIVERVYATWHLRESCAGKGSTFENDFWTDRKSGEVWQSRQWVGPRINYVSLQLLVP